MLYVLVHGFQSSVLLTCFEGCGNTIANGGAPAASGCTMACKGNATEYCGGGNRLNVYQFGNVGGSASTTSSSKPSSSTSTPTTPNSPTGLPSGWSYKGCYVDNANGRILINGQPNDPQLTVQKCVSACVTAGYSVAGMEYGSGMYLFCLLCREALTCIYRMLLR